MATTETAADRRKRRKQQRLARYTPAERLWLQISHHSGIMIGLLLVSFCCYAIGKSYQRSRSEVAKEKITANPTPDQVPSPKPVQTAEAPADLAALIERVERSVVRIDVTDNDNVTYGSGFIVDASGVIATNYHVIAKARQAEVVFSDGARFSIEGTVGTVPEKDIALLSVKLPSERIKPLPLSEALPRKGTAVIACGAPFGLSFTASQGIVSALRTGEELKLLGVQQAGTWIQTTTPISPGSSGGPLIDLQGRVVAANTMQIDTGQNLNFGIGSLDIQLAIKNREQQTTPLPGRNSQRVQTVQTQPPRIENIIGSVEASQLLERINALKLMLLAETSSSKVNDLITASVRRKLTASGVVIDDEARALLLMAVHEDTAGTQESKLFARLFLTSTTTGETNEAPVLFLLWQSERELGRISEPRVTDDRLPPGLRRHIDEALNEFLQTRNPPVRTFR